MTVDVIELTEYHAQFLAADRLPQEAAELLAHRYQTQIGLEAPSIFNNNRWKLVSQGWVGYLPLTRDLHLALLPKVPLGNVLRMLELVYDLSDFKVLEGLYEASSLDDFFERLAKILAHKVLDRFRRGIYRTYEPQADDLPYVRGRLDMVKTLVRPGRVDLACDFEEHTADGEDNQLLAWTLEQILRSGRCTEGRSLGYVRQAVRRFHGVVTPSPFHAQACVGRAYHRLNTDYRPLHALCYFFLSHTGPTHRQGEHEMVPFLVGMARLFEQFVARWLAQRLAPQYRVEGQRQVALDADGKLKFQIDLMVYAGDEEAPRWVMDTKYKAPERGPAVEDIAQVVAYATRTGAQEAILVYPSPLPEPADLWLGPVHVRTLVFALDGDLAQAGEVFLSNLFKRTW